MIRVAFFSALDFYGPILAPVRDALADRADTLLTADRRAIARFRPHVLVMAYFSHLEFFRRALPETFIVNIRHGMIGKGGLHRLPRRESARRFDALAVGDRIGPLTSSARALARPPSGRRATRSSIRSSAAIHLRRSPSIPLARPCSMPPPSTSASPRSPCSATAWSSSCARGRPASTS